MGLDAPILPPGGASRPKLRPSYDASPIRTACGTKVRPAH